MTVQVRWGIAGVGKAGRARARAILDDERAALVAGWRGTPSELGVPSVDSFDALLGEDVDAVAICSPDVTHARLVEAALRARKHVVCEFPLAGDHQTAEHLYALAATQGRLLHVGHIELLSPAARWLRGRVVGRQVLGGSVRFRGGVRVGVTSVAHANIARLHRLMDVVGEPTSLAVRWRDEESLQAVLRYSGNPERYDGMSEIQLEFVHGHGLVRRTELVLELSDGSVMMLGASVFDRGSPVALANRGGLFAQDHAAAMAAIVDDQAPYIDQARVLAGIRLAERLSGAPITGGAPRRGLPMRELDGSR